MLVDTARKRAIRPCTLVPVELSTGTNGSILYRSKNQSLLVPARGSSRYYRADTDTGAQRLGAI